MFKKLGQVRNNRNVRLVDGRNDRHGRIEVQYQGQWGTVCKDDFGMTDANVACRMMGLGKALGYCSHNREVCSSNWITSWRLAAGSGEIWLDNLGCRGYENSLFACAHPGVGVENCSHEEDMGVICESKKKCLIKF